MLGLQSHEKRHVGRRTAFLLQASGGGAAVRYWPMMTIARSPLLPAPFVYELSNFYYKMPSEGAFYAALAVAQHTAPIEMPNLAVIETEGGTYHRMYTSQPSQ